MMQLGTDRALLVGTRVWRGGIPSLLAVAAVLSLSIKAWSSPHAGVLVAGILGTLCVWGLALRRPAAVERTPA